MLDTNNKPAETDPSDNQNVDEGGEEKSLEDTIAERVLESVRKQQEENNSSQTGQTPDKGGKEDVVNNKESSEKDTSKENLSEDTALLDLLKATTGREFTSVDDAKKHLSNLNSLVGDQRVAELRNSADAYQSLVSGWAKKNGVTADEAKKFLADNFVEVSTKDTVVPQKDAAPRDDDKTSRLEDEVGRLSLLRKYPEAEPYVEEVSILAKAKNLPYATAFEQSSFKELAQVKAQEDSKKSPIVTPSNRKGFDTNKVERLGKKMMSLRGTQDDSLSLIQELGLHE